MLYRGSCNCNRWQVEVSVTQPLGGLNPRVCDCSYCENNPSAILSDPTMVVKFVGGEVAINQNGDQLASFYYCSCCGDLLAVGRSLNGQLRGAVNSSLLRNANQLGNAIQIQPRLLSVDEKLDRWGKLWAVLTGL